MSKAANLVGLFYNSATSESPKWARICKSTVLTISANAETEDFDYICDVNKTTEVKAYAPAIDQDLAVIPGNADYEFFYDLWYSLPTSASAHKEILVVYLGHGDNSAGYESWKSDATIQFTDYNAVDGKLNFNISFAGTITKGLSILTDGVPSFSPSA
jgi:hypothetical protein